MPYGTHTYCAYNRLIIVNFSLQRGIYIVSAVCFPLPSVYNFLSLVYRYQGHTRRKKKEFNGAAQKEIIRFYIPYIFFSPFHSFSAIRSALATRYMRCLWLVLALCNRNAHAHVLYKLLFSLDFHATRETMFRSRARNYISKYEITALNANSIDNNY